MFAALSLPSPFPRSCSFVEDELDELKAEIVEVKADIKKVEGELEAKVKEREGLEENSSRFHRLDKEIHELREEKNKLRDKEKQLREEKNKLLEIQSKLLDQRVSPPSPSGSSFFFLSSGIPIFQLCLVFLSEKTSSAYNYRFICTNATYSSSRCDDFEQDEPLDLLPFECCTRGWNGGDIARGLLVVK
jgi:hypothetical protein